MEEEYLIKLPKADAYFMDDDLSFSIGNIRSRETSTLYFILELFDMSDNLIYTYTSERWVIDTVYSSRHRDFKIPSEFTDMSAKYQITLIASGISSENPLYFNNIMFREGEWDGEYHQTDEYITEYEIQFNKSSYANLYSPNGTYLQVIRPSKAKLHTNKLDKCICTVLAPHLEYETDVDSPVAVFLEFINMTEQRIDVLR